MTHEELITLYFENALTQEQQLIFDDLRKTNPLFEEELAFQMQVKKAVTLQNRADLKAQLQELDLTENDTKHRAFHWRPWLVAASLLLVFLTAYKLLNPEVSNTNLFAENFELYPNVMAPQVRGSVDDALKVDAFAAYDAGKYEDAVALFSELLENHETKYAYFYRAQAYLALKKYREAQADLLLHLEVYDLHFQTESLWYLGLIHLKLDDPKTAKVYFEQVIKGSNHPFQVQAERLLKDLR